MSANRHKVKHHFLLSKARNTQLELIGMAVKIKNIAAKIVRDVCDNGFYHWQLSHDDNFMERLERAAESHKMTRSELIHYGAMNMIREMELHQSSPIYNELELNAAIEKGTKAWAGVPDSWLEEIRGNELTDAQKMEMHRQIAGIPRHEPVYPFVKGD